MFSKIKTFLKNHYKKILILLGILGIIVLVFFQTKPQEPELIFENPQYRDITKTLEVSGAVDAKRKARLRFLAGGKIVYLGANEGDWVKKWQTLATIDQRDLEKRLEKSLNFYSQQRWDWEDLQDNIKDQSLNTADQRYVDKQQWNLDNTVLDVEIQDIAISQAVMSAPFAGILVHQPINATHIPITANEYFEIVDPQSLIFKAEVNEEDIALIRNSQPAEIILDAYLTEKIDSQINYISYISTQSTGGSIFIIEFPLVITNENSSINADPESQIALLNKYRLGMNGDALIELESKSNVLTIPMIATKAQDDKVFVSIKNSLDEVEEREVVLGLETEEYVEILSGLTADDLILIPSSL